VHLTTVDFPPRWGYLSKRTEVANDTLTEQPRSMQDEPVARSVRLPVTARPQAVSVRHRHRRGGPGTTARARGMARSMRVGPLPSWQVSRLLRSYRELATEQAEVKATPARLAPAWPSSERC
jgi:hypothetical protein